MSEVPVWAGTYASRDKSLLKRKADIISAGATLVWKLSAFQLIRWVISAVFYFTAHKS